MKELIELAKEKGFLEIPEYIQDGYFDRLHDEADYLWMCLLQKWVRKQHDIHINVHPVINFKWSFSTYDVTQNSLLYAMGTGYVGESFTGESYEEALEKGLLTVLESI